MQDYYVTLRVQQGRLKSAMRQMGVSTAAELSRRSGASSSRIGEILNFRLTPRTNDGQWRRTTLKICKALGAEPDDIFPEHLDHATPTNQIEAFVEQTQLSGAAHRQLNPYEECLWSDTRRIVDGAIKTLTKREQSVLRARFFEHKTIKQAALDLGISRTRVWQSEKKAIRKLRLLVSSH